MRVFEQSGWWDIFVIQIEIGVMGDLSHADWQEGH